MAKKTSLIIDAIRGHAYFDKPLQDYHTAKAIMNALRRKDAQKRLSGVREALNKYRVASWLNDDGTIRLSVMGETVLML